jgi:membrane protein implicated in regulation of membrane protease activity
LHAWQVWVVAALLLFVAEMFAPGFWLACVAVGSLAAGAVAAVLPGLLAPVLAFSAGTILSLVALRPFLLEHVRRPGRGVRTNVDALIGKTGIVSERIEPGAGRGRVVVDGEDWRGASADDTPIEAGTRVMVLGVDGTTLFVEQEP